MRYTETAERLLADYIHFFRRETFSGNTTEFRHCIDKFLRYLFLCMTVNRYCKMIFISKIPCI